ncbi:MAG: TspO/MBR family protein [Pseudomonadota bacterium]
MTTFLKPALVLIAAIAFAATPFLAESFNGFDPNRYPIPQSDPPIQPIGWAFAIWGLIYLVLIIHAAFGVVRHAADAEWDRGRWPLILSLAVGAIWIPVANISPVWATVLIWVMLIAVLWSLYASKNAEPYWVASWPVALYAGWLSAASFVAIGLLLAGYGVMSEVSAAILCLGLATGFAIVNQIKLRLWTYGAAVCWAIMGIAVANAESSKLLTGLSIGALIIIAGLTLFNNRIKASIGS